MGLFSFQMAVLWLINRGDPNHLLLVNGMILQVGPPNNQGIEALGFLGLINFGEDLWHFS